MNCCDQECHQGKDCPIRQGYGHRRVRAGQPIQYTEEQLEQWRREDERMDLEDWLTVASAIVLAVVVVVWLVAVGGMFA